MKITNLALLVTLSLAAGCGTPVKTKEDAAAALNRVAFAGNSAGNQKSFGGSGLQDITVTVSGKKGSCTVTIKGVEANEEGVTLNEELKFDKFSADGDNVLNGTESLGLKVAVDRTGAGASLSFRMKGTMELKGDFDSALDFDVTMSVSASQLKDQSGGKVSMVLNGFIKADGQTFTYSNETFNVDAHKS